jgi:hypothetical protein
MNIIAKTHDQREMGLLAELLKKFVDTDTWAVARLRELRGAGEFATARVVWAPHAIGTVFTVQIRRADGTIESDPFDALEAQKGSSRS